MKPGEMVARLKPMPEALRLEVWDMLRAGWGSYGISLETRATYKEVNAVVAWWDKYGDWAPTDKEVAALGAYIPSHVRADK